MAKTKELIPPIEEPSVSTPVVEEEVSPIKAETDRFKLQVDEIQDSIESIKLYKIKSDDVLKLKLTETKMDLMLKLPKLLLALRELKESVVSSSGTRGAQKLSLIEKDEI